MLPKGEGWGQISLIVFRFKGASRGFQFKKQLVSLTKLFLKSLYNVLNDCKKMTVRDILKGILAYLKGMVVKDFLLAPLVADPGLLVLLQGLQNLLEALFTNKPENDIYIIIARLS